MSGKILLGTGNQLSNCSNIELILQEVGYAFQVQFRKKQFDRTGDDLLKLEPDVTSRTSTGQAPDMLRLLNFCKEERSVKDMMGFIGLKHRETFLQNYLHPLMENGLVNMIIPDKPKSPKQRYIITPKGLEELRDDLAKK